MNRITFEFSDQQVSTLNTLSGELDTSKVDVLRRALCVLQTIVREHRLGNSVGFIRGERVVKELVGVCTDPMGGVGA